MTMTHVRRPLYSAIMTHTPVGAEFYEGRQGGGRQHKDVQYGIQHFLYIWNITQIKK